MTPAEILERIAANAWLIAYASVAGLFIGFCLGKWGEARLWRGKAEGNPRYRMSSGGKLYSVWPADEFDEMHSEWVAMKNARMKARPIGRGGGYA